MVNDAYYSLRLITSHTSLFETSDERQYTTKCCKKEMMADTT